MVLYRTIDIGGGTGRFATAEVDRRKQVTLKTIQAKAEKFNGGRELIEMCTKNLTAEKFAARQNRVVISIAGPVNTEAGTIVKLTNQTGIEERDIPLASELEASLMESNGRKIKVDLINDGTAGTYAELSAQGALAGLDNGSLAMALIIGNGVGGGLNQVVKGQIKPMPGAHELGHFPIPKSVLDRSQLTKLLPAELKCGCQTVWNARTSATICLDSAAKGPTMKAIFQNLMRETLWQGYWDTATSEILGVVKNGREMGSDEAVGELTNQHITEVLEKSKGNNSLCQRVLSGQAAMLAYRLAAMQRGYDNLGPINVALIGGIGLAWGPKIVDHINKAFDEMATRSEIPVWGNRPEVRVGNFAAAETNLYGNIFYMQSQEPKELLRIKC
ncbi:MAG: ROK family protein [Candidatus Margulisbacteria bacterium]|nr:ROK family protein [Candidatus Margulisiibacteriota bacterium]